jgi:hypothetical protein
MRTFLLWLTAKRASSNRDNDVLLRKVDKGLSDIWFLCREKIAIEGITFSALERQSGRNIRSALR